MKHKIKLCKLTNDQKLTEIATMQQSEYHIPVTKLLVYSYKIINYTAFDYKKWHTDKNRKLDELDDNTILQA